MRSILRRRRPTRIRPRQNLLGLFSMSILYSLSGRNCRCGSNWKKNSARVNYGTLSTPWAVEPWRWSRFSKPILMGRNCRSIPILSCSTSMDTSSWWDTTVLPSNSSLDCRIRVWIKLFSFWVPAYFTGASPEVRGVLFSFPWKDLGLSHHA